MKYGKNGVKKRGVSPLIATVLLISFAVALGSVVLNWGRNLDISAGGDPCSEISIQIRDQGGADVCYTGQGQETYLHFVIHNEGKKAVNGLGVWIVGQKGTKLLDFDLFFIGPAGTLDIADNSVQYDMDTYGTVKHVQFIPKVLSDDSLDICPSQSIKAEKVALC